jgi:hypothetical protein
MDPWKKRCPAAPHFDVVAGLVNDPAPIWLNVNAECSIVPVRSATLRPSNHNVCVVPDTDSTAWCQTSFHTCTSDFNAFTVPSANCPRRKPSVSVYNTGTPTPAAVPTALS